MSAFSSNPAEATAAPGVAPDLRHAIGGIWRISYRRVLSRGQLISLFWTTAILAGLTYVSTRTGNEASFYGWTIRIYLTTVIPILAFMGGAGAIREDMKPGGVDYLLTRPVPRPAFVAARFVSHLVCAQLTCLVPFAAVLGVGVVRGIDNLATAWPALWLAQVMALTAFMALGFLFGSISARFLILGVNYAAIIEVGLGRIPIQLSNLSVLRHVKSFLLPLTPDVGATNLEPQSALTTVAFLTIFTVVWVAGAALIFSVQEFAGQKPKEN
jgi:ABC-2 type transport system permease protein